jgi:anaerobic selenocysteine-containing dehydrogenase
MMNPKDAAGVGVQSGDIVELFNDYGSTFAMAYLEPDTKAGQSFMQFGYYDGLGQRDHQLDGPQHHPVLQGHLGEHSPCRRPRRLQEDH